MKAMLASLDFTKLPIFIIIFIIKWLVGHSWSLTTADSGYLLKASESQIVETINSVIFGRY